MNPVIAPNEPDLRRLDLLRRFPAEKLRDIPSLERLIVDLGLYPNTAQWLEEFPESLWPACDQGLRLWQYPNQFARCLAELSRHPIRSYLEIGVAHGGTLITIVEYLRRFSESVDAFGVDPVAPSDLLRDYMRENPSVRYVQDGSERLRTRLDWDGAFFDLVLIDGLHDEPHSWADFELVKDISNIILFHDITNDHVPGVGASWNRLKREYSGEFEFFEFTEQYAEVTARTGQSFLGIGMAVRKTWRHNDMKLVERFRFPESTETTPLYLHLSGNADLVLAGNESLIRMGKGSLLSLNAYFNSFYEKIWKTRTNLRSLHYQFRIRGKFTVRIYRQRPYQPRVLLSETEICRMPESGIATIRMPEAAGRFESLGRVYPEITALENGEFFGGRIVTDQKPEREVALGIVSVTYKKEDFIRGVIARWSSDQALMHKNTKFYVVDNGATLDPAEFPDPRLRIIPNRNLGGSGGFNRGLLEASDEGGFTHHLLMDDDIVLDSESILRLITFYEYADDEYGVSGSMLDIEDPLVLYESGANMGGFRNGRQYPLFHVQCLNSCQRLDRPQNIDALFDKEIRFDSAGFWFFGFPSAWLRQAGYLMPFFIHGDDIEFCLRLKNKFKHKILALPSLAIWHHTWRRMRYRQPAPLVYYGVRNLSVLYFLHANVRYLRIVAELSRSFLARLFTFNYEEAAFMLLGLRHAMEGPRFLAETEPADLHKRLRTLYAGLNDVTRQSFPLSPAAVPQLFRTPHRRFWKRIVLLATLNGHLVPDFHLKEGPATLFEQNWEQAFGFKRAVVVHDAFNLQEFRMRRRTCISLLFEWVGLCLKLAVAGGRIQKSWRDAFASMTEPAFVRKFGA